MASVWRVGRSREKEEVAGAERWLLVLVLVLGVG